MWFIEEVFLGFFSFTTNLAIPLGQTH